MDIIYVTYNSEKWINNCFHSLLESEYNLSLVNIIVVDNSSTDNTIQKLKSIQHRTKDKFKTFQIIESKDNLGFGKGNNLGFEKGNSEIVCFFNIDTEVFPDTLSKIEEEVKISPKEVGLWELRQFPYEHPKFYQILTGYTSWSSGAAFVVRRDVFQTVGGFDNKIFMYAEDVDLSWRIRAKGYYLKYCPDIKIMHYSYENANQIKPTQYYNSIINNLLLRYRFANWNTIVKGHLQFWNIIRQPAAFEGSKKGLLKRYCKHFINIPHFISWRLKKENKIVPIEFKFLGFDYEITRDGAFYVNSLPIKNELVSIIVRTCGRPDVLRENLLSLRKQTYKNLEIVIVEDGEEKAGPMIGQEFSDLNINYYATGKKVGRSAAGNLAMSMAKGKYLNFLDDDDLFYPEHVEVLVKNFENTSNKAVYARAFEVPTITYSTTPYSYKEVYHNVIHRQNFNRAILCHHNYIPIQCIMFEKELFNLYGGLDETLDALEDWDMWVRFALHTDFTSIEKLTSLYRVPYTTEINENRQKALDEALITVREKHKKYLLDMNVYDVAMMVERMIL